MTKAKEGIRDYDPNRDASRQEMGSFVCGQCHVEYYFKGDGKIVTFPWANGLKAEQIEAYYDVEGFSDWVHAETGDKVLKAQHPEFEVWSPAERDLEARVLNIQDRHYATSASARSR